MSPVLVFLYGATTISQVNRHDSERSLTFPTNNHSGSGDVDLAFVKTWCWYNSVPGVQALDLTVRRRLHVNLVLGAVLGLLPGRCCSPPLLPAGTVVIIWLAVAV